MEIKEIIKSVTKEHLLSTNRYNNKINEELIFKDGYPLFYHGATNMDLNGKNGIHVGTMMAAKQALEAKIGVPAHGEWDGKRKYGETLLAGKKRLKELNYTVGYDPIMNFNATEDVPEENYYPHEREKRAVYFSTKDLIPLNCNPIIFKVKIVGKMVNSYDKPYTDSVANDLINKNIKNGDANGGYYYINEWEDEFSISAVVPNGNFLELV